MENQQEKVAEFFSRDPKGYAEAYDLNTPEGYSFIMRRKRLLEMLGKGNGRVLDIGCGPAVMTEDIVCLGWNYDGIDISAAMIDEAKKRLLLGSQIAAEVADRPRTNFRVGSVEKIDSPDNIYDVVVAMGLVEYVDDDATAIKEMNRVLKHNGRLIVSLPNWWSPVRMWDRWIIAPLSKLLKLLHLKKSNSVLHREYRPHKYSKLLKAYGFEPLKIVAYNFRIVPRPFDKVFKRLAIWTASKFEFLRNTPFWFFGTGVIVEAIKISDCVGGQKQNKF